jgi:DNA-binding SARP family transcriptional activator
MTLAPTRSRHPALAVLLNLVGQLLLLTAIPLALWKLYGNPIPKRIPSWEQIQFDWRGIEAQPSQLVWPVLTVMADILWIVWAWYAISLAFKLLWILLHLPRAILTGTLGAITPALAFRALSLSALATHPATPVHSASTATAPSAPAPVRPAATGPRTLTAGTGTTVDVVEPGDNLWDLAEHHYHHGEDWHEIYNANKGAEQPDRQHLQNPDLIQPGWHLVIPAIPEPGTAAPNTAANGTAPAARPAPTPPHGPVTARPAPNRAPGRPAPAPAATAPHAPGTAPARHPGGAARPASERPHTVGHALPHDAGYIGITLVTSIAAAVTILRARNRHRGRPKNEGIPDLAQHIAAVHSLARSAQDFGFRHEDHPDMDTPPLYEPIDGQVTIATSPDGRTEIPLDPDTRPGPLVLTGPGAHDAARALAINTLATGHTLETDPETSTELLGSPAPTQPRNPEPGTTRIRTTQSESDDEPSTVIIDATGRNHTADPHHTIIEVDTGHTVQHATGPEADSYIGTRIHTLTAQAAATIHETLQDAQPGPRATPAAPASRAGVAATNTEPAAFNQAPDPTRTARELSNTPLVLRVLGRPDILRPDGTVTDIETEQAGALLTILALHPDGIPARDLLALEWPGTTNERRPKLTLSSAVTRIRSLLRAALGTTNEQTEPVLYDKTSKTYRLNPDTATTDLALALQLTHRADAATGDEQLQLLIQAAALHRHQLAGHLDDQHRDWLTTARYTVLGEATALHLRIAEISAQALPETAAGHLTEAVALAPEDPRTVTAALRACRRIQRPDLARTIHRQHIEALHAMHEEPGQDVEQFLAEITGKRAGS